MQEINYAEAVCSNGAVMPHYRHYTIPGADWLGFAEPSVYVFTQPASAAAQSGRKRVMAEAFAMCGWNLNFRGMKHLYSQMQLLGINFLCTHLQSYSLRGMAQAGLPALPCAASAVVAGLPPAQRCVRAAEPAAGRRRESGRYPRAAQPELGLGALPRPDGR